MQIMNCRESLTVICHDFPKAQRLVLAMGVSERRSLAYHHKEFKKNESKLSSYESKRFKVFFEDMKEWYSLYRSMHKSDRNAEKAWSYWASHDTDGLKDGTYRQAGGKIVRKRGSADLKITKLKFSQLV